MSGSPLLDVEAPGAIPAAAPRERAGSRTGALRAVLAGGFLYGALLYGGVLSLVHVSYNRLGSTRDALVTLAAFLLLYGAWAAAAFALGRGLAGAASRLRHRAAPAGGSRHGALTGMLLFNLFFWELFWLYGLTYDQVPFGPPSGAAGMLAYVAALVVVIAVAVALGSWLLSSALRGLWRRGWLPRLAVAGVAALLAAHAAAPLWAGRGAAAPARPAVEGAAPVRADETGLKVVFVGLDGADWQVIRPMIERGELPTFARLAREGASGPLATIHDSNSAVIWASIYSGKAPADHGVLDFYRIELPGLGSDGIFPVHRTYFKELADRLGSIGLARQTMVSRRSLRALPIWEIADRAGLSIGVVDGYFYSIPALVPSRPESYFVAYGLDAFEQLPDGKNLRQAALFAQPVALYRRLRPLLDRPDFYWQSAALLELLGDRPQPAFVNFYTHEPDTTQHLAWKWFQPQYYLGVTAAGLAENADRIPALHRDFDAFLGSLLAAVEPGTVVVVASDHGHAPTMLHGDYYTQHRHGPPGILLLAGGPVRPGLTVAGRDIYDLYPTLLYLLGLPVPEDAVGEVMTEALDPEFVRRHPVRRIPTYQGLWPERAIESAPDGGLNEQEIEKLRSLGYL